MMNETFDFIPANRIDTGRYAVRPFARSLKATAAVILALTPILSVTGCADSAQEAEERAAELLLMAEQGDLSALDALLRRSPQADVRDQCSWTPLMKAAANGHLATAGRLLDAGADVDAADKGGYTSLLLAASNNHTDLVKLLVDRGAMIDARESTQGFTALIWAAQRGHRETVELLLASGADRTLPDFEGKRAADRAASDAIRNLLRRPGDAPGRIAISGHAAVSGED